MRLRIQAAVALALALAACAEEQADPLPPTDAFYFPIGLATSRLTQGTLDTGDDTTALLVSSSNYDLRYSASEGGTLLSIAPLTSTDPSGLVPRGERIGSYAGPIAVADAVTCATLVPGAGDPVRAMALVASRYDDRIYRFELDDAGALSLASVADAPDDFDDPFAVAVACGAAGNRAYVAYLDPPDSSRGSGAGAWISEIDLPSGTLARQVELGDGPVRAMAYDPATDRLWATTMSDGTRALLHSVVLSDPRWEGATPWEAVDTIDLFPWVRGAELRSIAVGTPPPGGGSRLFLTARLYDVEAQASSGNRPSGDIGGALIVLDVVEGADGRPVASVRAVESLGLGVSDVAVVRRAGGEDLALVTARDEGLLFVYDDATGAVARLFDANTSGAPVLGDRPLALAVDQVNPGDAAQVYVASFGDHVVHRFSLDPAAPTASSSLEKVTP